MNEYTLYKTLLGEIKFLSVSVYSLGHIYHYHFSNDSRAWLCSFLSFIFVMPDLRLSNGLKHVQLNESTKNVICIAFLTVRLNKVYLVGLLTEKLELSCNFQSKEQSFFSLQKNRVVKTRLAGHLFTVVFGMVLENRMEPFSSQEFSFVNVLVCHRLNILSFFLFFRVDKMNVI